MLKSRIYLVQIALCIGMLPQGLLAQSVPSDEGLMLLRKALTSMEMGLHDLAMPTDFVTPDRHRTDYHSVLFLDPLRSIELTVSPLRLFRNPTSREIRPFVKSMMKYMDLGESRRVIQTNTLDTRQLYNLLGASLEKESGLIGSVMLYSILDAVLAARTAIEPARHSLLSNQIVVSYCDSLWMLSAENENASLWDSYSAQKSGMETSEAFFAKANPRIAEVIYNAGVDLYEHIVQFLPHDSTARKLLSDSVRTTDFNTKYGRIGIGGMGNDVWSGDYMLIIDVGGDDVYNITTNTKAEALGQSVRVIVDFSGNDVYRGGSYSLGCGFMGIGIVVDKDGNDRYVAGDFSLGCGLFGIGILHDVSGSDVYDCISNGQGAGYFGIGMLIDDQGSDLYKIGAQGQGFGATRGIGVLCDKEGNDQYLAISPFKDVLRYEDHHVTFTQGAALGSRPAASGGIGILYDLSGNDLYVCDIYGQGTAYWFGMGLLLDASGSDRYQAYQYAQGAGVHFGNGILADITGDDIYVSHGVSQGCGHDVATGMIYDEAGNDIYIAESLSQGAGNANAVSILLDLTGNDSYTTTNSSNTQGYSDFRRSYGMIGIFADGGGVDLYSSRIGNDTFSIKSTYGIRGDWALFQNQAGSTSVTEPAYVEMPLASTVDSLMIQASAAPLRFQNNVAPARNAIIAMGEIVVGDLAPYLGTLMPRERLAIETILPRIYESAAPLVTKLVIDSLYSSNLVVASNAATIAGKTHMTQALEALSVMATSNNWKRRRTALQAIADIGNPDGSGPCLDMLSDPHDMVRSRAAYCLGILGKGQVSFDTLITALTDSSQIVRMSAVEGLCRSKVKLPASVFTRWITSEAAGKYLLSNVRLIGAVDTSAANTKIVSGMFKRDPGRLNRALSSVFSSIPPYWQKALSQFVGYKPQQPAKRK